MAMSWRKRFEKEAASIRDPLIRRIFRRTQLELKREERREAIYRGALEGARANGNAAAGLAILFLFSIMWAVVSGTIEHIACEWRLFKTKKDRKRKPGIGLPLPEIARMEA